MSVLELSRWQFGIVLAYQGWTYWVFRKRLGATPQAQEPTMVGR